MSSTQLLALIVQHGLPAAMEIAQILRQPEEEVTDEMWEELRKINSRPFDFYEGARPTE